MTDGFPMLGFIFMIDPFGEENGATRFVRGSHRLDEPPNGLGDDDGRLAFACGTAGSMILFNGSCWHGHGANRSDAPRRSIQGALIRWDQQAAVDHARETRPDVAARLSDTAKALLSL